MKTSELRRRAKAVYLACEHAVADDISLALSEAADEIDRLREEFGRCAEMSDLRFTKACQWQNERDEARAECAELQQGVENLNALSTVAMGEIAWLRAIVSLVRSLLSEDGVKDSLAHLSVFHVLMERLG